MDWIQKLADERDALAKRISEIDHLLQQHEALHRQAQRLLGNEKEYVAEAVKNTPKSGVRRESSGRRGSAEVKRFEEMIRQVLLEAREPLNRSDLLVIATERSIPVGGQDPINTLASRMSRMHGVTNISGQGYWLEERANELFPAAPPLAANQQIDAE